MLKLPLVLLFTAMTAIFWGVYGILLHQGTERLGHSMIRAFIGVGIAYFLIAVLVPVGVLSSKKEKGFWSLGGALLSLFAGTVGALGALGIIRDADCFRLCPRGKHIGDLLAEQIVFTDQTAFRFGADAGGHRGGGCVYP